jgi:hypothetical protein
MEVPNYLLSYQEGSRTCGAIFCPASHSTLLMFIFVHSMGMGPHFLIGCTKLG